jgi:hypothetical protein
MHSLRCLYFILEGVEQVLVSAAIETFIDLIPKSGCLYRLSGLDTSEMISNEDDRHGDMLMAES